MRNRILNFSLIFTLALDSISSESVEDCLYEIRDQAPCSNTYQSNILPFLSAIDQVELSLGERAALFNSFFNRIGITVAQNCVDNFFKCEYEVNNVGREEISQANLKNVRYFLDGLPQKLLSELSPNLLFLMQQTEKYLLNPTAQNTRSMLNNIIQYQNSQTEIQEKWKLIFGMINFKLGIESLDQNIFGFESSNLNDISNLVNAMKNALKSREVRTALEEVLEDPEYDLMEIYKKSYQSGMKNYNKIVKKYRRG